MNLKVIKALFLARLMREKMLVLAFLLLAVAIWGSSFFGRAKRFSSDFSRTSADLQMHAEWLGRRDQIQANAKQAIAKLDPSQTLDGTKLFAEVKKLADQAGLANNVTVDDNRNERSTQFAVHSLRFTVRKTDYATLIRFYQEIQKRSPYIGIEQFTLGAQSNPTQLDASIRFTSVEVVK